MPRYLVTLMVVFFLLQSCATIEKKDVQVIDLKKSQVSKVLAEQGDQRFLKRKVAIARFTNETKYGRSFFLAGGEDPLSKQALDILSARLTETDKFILLERSDVDKIHKELELKLMRGEFADLNISADYLIIGSISEFGRKTTGQVGLFSRTKKQGAYAKVNIRLIDVYTGQAIYSEEGYGEAFSETGTVLGLGGRSGYDYTLNDKVISAAISKLVNNIIENLLDKPWRSYVLAYENGYYVIGGGKSQGIKRDDVFGVFLRGKRIKNPQTNMYIELPGRLIGKVKVENLLGRTLADEVSLCSIVEGVVPKKGFTQIYVQDLTACR